MSNNTNKNDSMDAESIVHNVRRADGNVSFARSLGSFVQNEEFKRGYIDFINGKDSAGAYVWKALSAIGQDVNSIVYSNVANYIDAVTNIDTCTVKSLKSMMKLVGSSYELFGNLDMLPIEVLQLLDVLSISKKYLLQNDKVKQELVDSISASGPLVDYSDLSCQQPWQYRYLRNAFEISAVDVPMCINGIYGRYDLVDDYAYSYIDGPSYLENDKDRYKPIPLNVAVNLENYQTAGEFPDGKVLSGLVCRKYESGTDWKIVKMHLYSPSSYGLSSVENYFIVDRSNKVRHAYSAEQFELSVSQTPLYNFIDGLDGYVKCIPESISLETQFIDGEKYKQYVQHLYKSMLLGFISMKYNTKISSAKPIYCYLKDEYYKTNDYYEKIDNSTDSRRRFKSKNNIPLQFDEKAIVDSIDQGTDSLDNYFGAELELLKIEIDYRARALSFSSVDASYDGTENTVEKYTRYSYYRRAKVLEYMKFVDNQYYAGNSVISSSAVYAFNPNYYEVERSQEADCHVMRDLSAYDGDVSNEIRTQMVDDVASMLAELTMYIQKLREKVRLQTRKNYMKGTNNLIRYVANEYLVDLARNSPIFKADAAENNYLKDVRAELSSHDIDNIEVVEYYDTTEYYNIQTSTTDAAANGDTANSRYWENIIAQDLNGRFQARDGIDISQEQIHGFYLSTLNLKNQLSDSESNVYAFLSTIFDLGANTSYISKDGAFVTKLSSGQYSDEVYAKFIELSADYDQLKEYSDGYQFDTSSAVKDQLSGLVQFLTSKVSAEYFAEVSSNFKAYMPRADQLSNDVDQLSQTYDQTLSSFEQYLSRSDSSFSYRDGNALDPRSYKHDYYIDNPDVYDAQMLLDKLGDLRSFAADSSNMHVWAFSDGLSSLGQQFSSLSSKVNDLRAKVYEAGIDFTDVDSEHIDDELQCIDNALDAAMQMRREQLQQIVSTGRSMADEQYQQLLSKLESSADEYKQLEKSYASIVSSYKSQYVNSFGASCMKFISKQKTDEDQDGSFTSKVTYKTLPIAGLESNESSSVKEKCKAAIAWMTQKIDWSGNGIQEEESMDRVNSGYGDADDEESEPQPIEPDITIEFGSEYNIPDSPYVLADPGIQAALEQIMQNVDDLEEQLQNASDELEPLNQAIYTVYDKLQSKSAYPGSIAFSQAAEGALADAFNDLAKQLKQQYIEKAGALDEASSLFKNDSLYSACSILSAASVQLDGQYSSFDSQYQTFINGKQVGEYLEGYSAKDKFSVQEWQNLQLFSSQKDDDARKSILEQIDSMYSTYYRIQEKYVVLMQELREAVPDGYFTNNYLETDLANASASLNENMQYNIDLAAVKMNAKMAELQKSIYSLAGSISASLGISGETVLQLFKEETLKHDICSDQQYIAAKELFYQYSGLSAGQAPFFNYKNLAHSTRQLHNFFWNFIEVDKYAQIANKAFDSVYVDQLETAMALSAVDNYIGKYGTLVDTWKNNVQDFTGYSTRYIDSSHTVPDYIGKFEVVDYDGAFYPPAISMLRDSPGACISSLASKFSVLDCVNAMVLGDMLDDDLGKYTAQDFLATAWTALKGDLYMLNVPDGNLKEVIDTYIYSNSVKGYNYTGEAVTWMTSTKKEFGKYVSDNVKKTFFERFYYPLGLSQKNYSFIASQLSCEEILDQILDITDSHERKDVYDIYNYGLDAYDNMYVLYKNYHEESPSYQTKKNTLGSIWIRLKNHPIAFPIALSSNQQLSPIDMSDANQYLKTIESDDISSWCYDFNFSDNGRLVCFTCKNKTEDLPEYFMHKHNYAQLAIASVSQKTNIDLERAVLKLSNPDDIPDDIVTQPHLAKLQLPAEGSPTQAYQFIGTYSPSLYNIGLVYVKTNLSYDEATEHNVHAYLDCPPEVLVLKASNETSNIELQESPTVKWSNSEFMLEDGVPAFKFDNDQAVFSYNFTNKQLTFAFLGKLQLENGIQADQYKPSTCQSISISASTDGSTIDDPAAKEMNSFDVFTDCVVVANAKPTSLGISMVGKVKLYNTNADASYIPLYSGKDATAYVDDMQVEKKPYYSFELLGKSNNIDEWISRANPYADTGLTLEQIYQKKVNGRIYEGGAEFSNDDYIELVKQEMLSTAVETFSPLLNAQHPDLIAINREVQANTSEDEEQTQTYTWTIDVLTSGLKYERLEDVHVVVCNTDLNGKNPYYVCTLQDMLSSNNIDGVKHACYNSAPSEYQSTDVSSHVFSNNAICKAVATQPYGWMDSVDNNYLPGISAMQSVFDEQSGQLKFTFMLEDDPNYKEYTYIPKDQIKVLLFNPKYLEVFNRFHLFDAYGLVYINDNLHPVVDRVGDGWYIQYGKSRFNIGPYYLDSKGYKHMLSDVNFGDANALSDVYVVQGYEHMHFKYDEQMIYDISSDMYYYPTINIKYPYTPGTYLESLGFEKELRSGSYYANVFNDTNFFSFRIDDPDEIADKIGNVSIGIQGRDSEIALVFEDYLSSDASKFYDYSDVRNFEYLQFFNPSSNETSCELDDDAAQQILSCNDLELALDKLAELSVTDLEAAGGDTSNASAKDIPQITFRASRKSVDLSEALKVYASYKKEDDKSITLYFNYMNYLDTPFVKIVDNNPVADVIDGTYLKLKAGEEGTLDIVVQFKYYAKQVVYGVVNVVIATYKIFNLSDTKPKFLVYKQQTVQPDTYEHINIDGKVVLRVQSAEYSRDDVESVDGNYFVDVIVDASADRIQLNASNSYTLNYNPAVLQYIGCKTSGCTVNSLKAGVLKIMTHEADVHAFVFEFSVVNADNMFKTSTTKADFIIEDAEYFYANNEPITNIDAYGGTITFNKDSDD